MSSSYSSAEIEAMRKERLRKELDSSIQQLKTALQNEHRDTSQIVSSAGIVMSVFDENEYSGFSDEDLAASREELLKYDISNSKHEDLDLSSLLEKSSERKKGRLAKELDSWIGKIDERPVIEANDEKDRTRLIKEVTSIVSNVNMDIEDKIRSVSMRVRSYLQGGVTLTDLDKMKIESDYFQYCALCKMLEIRPRERVPYRVRNEIRRITGILEKRAQDEYIMSVIESAMESMGCHIGEDAVLDHTAGHLFKIDGHPMCEVFIATDSAGIMYEPIGENAAADKKKELGKSVAHACSMYEELERRVAKDGVILKRIYHDPADAENMCVQSDISERRQTTRKKRNKTIKERSISLD